MRALIRRARDAKKTFGTTQKISKAYLSAKDVGLEKSIVLTHGILIRYVVDKLGAKRLKRVAASQR